MEKKVFALLLISFINFIIFYSCKDEEPVLPKLEISSSDNSASIESGGQQANVKTDYRGGTVYFIILSTSDWNAEVETSEGDKQWCFTTQANEKLSISIDYFVDGLDERTAEIKLQNKEGQTAAISIKQNSTEAAIISFDGEEAIIPSRGDTVEIEVNTTEDVVYVSKVIADVPWVKATVVERDGVNFVSVSAGKNIANETLTAQIEVSVGKDVTKRSAMFTVIQPSGELVLEYVTEDDAVEVAIPVKGDIDITIDWGDGVIEKTRQEITNYSPVTHTFEKAGAYEVSISGDVEILSSYFSSSQVKKVTDYLRAILQWGDLRIKSTEGGFQDTKITDIPRVIDHNTFEKVITARDMFYGCNELQEIPAGFLDGFVNCEDFMRIFARCNGLKDIPDGLFNKTVKATTLTNLFYLSENLENVPADLLFKMTEVTNAVGLFTGTSLKSIDKDFFKYNVNLTTLSNAFSQTQIEEIPEDIFFNNPFLENISSLFNNSELSSIPPNIFKNNPQLSSVSSAFSGTNITEIPEVLFKNNPHISTVASLFAGTNISEVPENLFVNNPKITNVNYLVDNCPNIKGLPLKLFDGLEITNARGLFRNCTGITEIPMDILKKITGITDFSEMFEGTEITTIPPEIFTAFPDVTSFYKTFKDCSNLQSIPVDIFKNNLAVNNVSSVFEGCTSVKGESPYNVIEETKYRLWERSKNSSVFAGIWSYSSAFKGCEGLTDWDDIPSIWK